MQGVEDDKADAIEQTARVMERIAYQNSELELLMDYKARTIASPPEVFMYNRCSALTPHTAGQTTGNVSAFSLRKFTLCFRTVA